jgi:hypothetical protein
MYGITQEAHGTDTGLILYENTCIFCVSKIWWQIKINGSWYWIEAHDKDLCIQKPTNKTQ